MLPPRGSLVASCSYTQQCAPVHGRRHAQHSKWPCSMSTPASMHNMHQPPPPCTSSIRRAPSARPQLLLDAQKRPIDASTRGRVQLEPNSDVDEDLDEGTFEDEFGEDEDFFDEDAELARMESLRSDDTDALDLQDEAFDDVDGVTVDETSDFKEAQRLAAAAEDELLPEDDPAARSAGQASTSDASSSDSKEAEPPRYPEPPERAIKLMDLFTKAFLPVEAELVAREFPDVAVYGLQAAAERVMPGDLFILHDFMSPEKDIELLQLALINGAVAVIGPPTDPEEEENWERWPTIVPYIPAKNPVDLAQRLAVAFYDAPSRDLDVVCISGSSGKTTVGWLVRGILEQMEKLAGMIGSIEYALAEDRLDQDGELWEPQEPDPTKEAKSSMPFYLSPYKGKYRTLGGTPPGLITQKLLAGMRDRGATAAVVEASSIALGQGWLDWMELKVAVFTGLDSKDRLTEFHGGTDELLDSQLRMFKILTDSSAQAAVVNLDADPSYPDAASAAVEAASEVPTFTYSLTNPAATVSLRSMKSSIWESELLVQTPGGVLQIITPLLGQVNASNVLAAVATGLALGAPLPDIVAGIEAVEVVPGRCEVIDEGQDFSVIVDAASTPESLKHLLTALRNASDVKRIFTIIGAKADTDPGIRPFLGQAAHNLSDFVILTNDSPSDEDPAKLIQELVAGFPDDIVNKYSGYAYFPFQDQGRCPLWFEPYLQKAQRDQKRYIMEDRFSAIRAAIGTAAENDVVVIAGRGHEDAVKHADEAGEILRGWFDDRVEARDALSKLQYLYKVNNLNRKTLPWGDVLETMESVFSVEMDRK